MNNLHANKKNRCEYTCYKIDANMHTNKIGVNIHARKNQQFIISNNFCLLIFIQINKP
jgi:hypothetical protein